MQKEKGTLLVVGESKKIDYDTTTPTKKLKRKNKSDLGSDFVAPDGGWGWVVCIAAGLSTFSVFPSLQQYGLLYRDRMVNLGFHGKQITTIINIELATSTFVGIINGALFRRFTFRQIAITGGIFVCVGITLSAFCTNFIQYLFSFSLIFGTGIGLNTSATALAVNTYFKKRRRQATSLTWAITGLGTIIFPQVSTYLLNAFGAQGAILIVAAIGLNAVACGFALQPVLWHVKPKKPQTHDDLTNEPKGDDISSVHMCKHCVYKADPDRPTQELVEPGPPISANASDDWLGSKTSLNSKTELEMQRRSSIRKEIKVGKEDAERTQLERQTNNRKYFNQKREERERYKEETTHRCTCAKEGLFLEKTVEDDRTEDITKLNTTLIEKIMKFFDLDLLRDLTFVNLVLGMTIMMFGEMNFSFLTPFILDSYGYKNEKISLAMSLLGGTDIFMRFLAPCFLEKIKFGNSTLFAFGIIIITVGRFIVTVVDSYYALLGIFMLIGFGKAFRTIFAPLILPSYVPLHRLPAATGLQLACNTLLSLVCGPLLGAIVDAFNYNIAIHFINLMSILSLMLWILEWLVRSILKRPRSHTQQY